MIHVASGESTTGSIPHTYGIIEGYLPTQLAAMSAAQQQHWDINFTAINHIHVPVALGSMLLLLAIVWSSLRHRQLDDITLLAATTCMALLCNAIICGV